MVNLKALFVGMVLAMVIGVVLGTNMGVQMAMQDGTKQACLNLRINMLNCNWQEPEHTP